MEQTKNMSTFFFLHGVSAAFPEPEIIQVHNPQKTYYIDNNYPSLGLGL